MKQTIFLLLSIGLIAFSCNKVKKLEDEISFRKFLPFLTLNPVDSVVQLYGSCDEFIPFPFDSVQSVEIDIDKNGENDFRFTYTTNYNFINSTDSCRNHNSSVIVKALGIGNNVVVENKTTKKAKMFEADDKIGKDYFLSSDAFIYLDNPNLADTINMGAGNKYIGVKMFSGSLGWIKVFHRRDTFNFSVMEHAINNNFHLDIKAGQKQ